MGRVEGKVALVTGGASGLGKATCLLLAREGARVAVTDLNGQGAEAVAEKINADGGRAIAITHDVTSEEGWKAAVAETESAFGDLHILVNNAGIGIMKNVEETSLEEWRHVHAVDTDGVFLGCKYALAAMARTTARGGKGSIVNISSVAGIIGGHNMAAYNSAKAGVRLLSKSVALHCARKGYNIRCNSVHPTFIDTPILDGFATVAGSREAALEKLSRQVPLGSVGEPDDVAYTVLFLACDESKFITGTEVIVDGGISAM